MNNIDKITNCLKKLGNTEKGKHLSGFFKTGKGQYGEGDVFIGITVPEQRKVAKEYSNFSLSEIKKLLESKIHEHRLTALLILVQKYSKSNIEDKKNIIDFYLDNLTYVNNWDLVDLSAPKLLGDYLVDKKEERNVLYKLAKSKNLWQKRISIVATYSLIKNKEFEDTIKISETLIDDNHDLIHKAVGWMLRELGKMNQDTEEEFLKKHHKNMPRTMLRYAIEKFNEEKRKFYMSK